MKNQNLKGIYRFSSVMCLIAMSMNTGLAQAQTAQSIEQEQLQKAQDRQKAIQEQQPQAPDVKLQTPSSETVQTLPITESPAFLIQHITLTGDSAERFQFALQSGLKQTGLHGIQSQDQQTYLITDRQLKGQGTQTGVMLGANGINILMKAAQNALVARGYTTSRILAEPQDLSQGTLTLTVVPGRIRHINVDPSNIQQTHADRAILFNALPMKQGDILNLRDIEQALENIKRVRTVEADIQIAPADTPNQSDLNIQWRQQTVPLRFNMAVDDSGSKATGKYQGTATLSVDSPFRINDLFYFSYGGDLSGYDKVSTTDEQGNINGHQHGGSNNWALHYSIPYGYWELAFNASRYHYNQAVAGANQTYTYSGTSRTQDLKLSRVLHRDSASKTGVYLKGWNRYSDSYIDDAEITVQRRKTAGYEIGLTHKHNIGTIQLNGALAFKRGTGAFNAISAPEEAFGEGTARMKLITADLSITVPWQIKQTPISFTSNNHAQWNKTPLTPQDKLAIGGRSTVRGFDGNMSLSAERGWYSRNELSLSYRPSHQIYLALDAGHVSGPSAQYLLGQTLIGTALGLRGQVKLGGNLSYDAFVGTPLRKPQGFQTAKTTYGFNLNYAF